MKAQSTLAAAAIRSEVVKTESGTSQHGCVYGVRFPANQYNNVRSILDSAHVTVRRYVSDGNI